MSYDISMICPHCKSMVEVDHFEEGGNTAIGGSYEAWLNITYNYGSFFRQFIDHEQGIRWLYGKTGAECQPQLERAVNKMKQNESANYWESTEGNARLPLVRLLKWAKQHPTAVFTGD